MPAHRARTDKLIIHCSDYSWGDAEEITRWHKERGFEDIGYHYVILNGRRKANDTYNESIDGLIEAGRSLDLQGAHCLTQNNRSIGICLIGKKDFTSDQMQRLKELVRASCSFYGLDPTKDIYGHYEFEPKKTCPNLDMEKFRKEMA